MKTNHIDKGWNNSNFENLDWVEQTSIKIKSQLYLANNLILCIFQVILNLDKACVPQSLISRIQTMPIIDGHHFVNIICIGTIRNCSTSHNRPMTLSYWGGENLVITISPICYVILLLYLALYRYLEIHEPKLFLRRNCALI